MNLQEELKMLKERITELEYHAKEQQVFPKRGDKYHFIEASGGVGWFQWDESGFGLRAQDIGNMFRTKEQAEFAVEKLKVEAELRKFSRPFKRDSLNVVMCFDTEADELYSETKRFMTQGAFYFEGLVQIQEAIKTIGEDRIKKYIFGVEG